MTLNIIGHHTDLLVRVQQEKVALDTTTDRELKEHQVNLPQENLGIPIDIQNIIHPVIIQGLVKDIKEVENFTQGM